MRWRSRAPLEPHAACGLAGCGSLLRSGDIDPRRGVGRLVGEGSDIFGKEKGA